MRRTAIHEGIELVITDVRSTRNFVVQAMSKEEVQGPNTSGMKICFQVCVFIAGGYVERGSRPQHFANMFRKFQKHGKIRASIGSADFAETQLFPST